MVLMITVDDVRNIVLKHGLNNIINDLIKTLKFDFARWDEFNLSSRFGTDTINGVIEIMPISDDKYHTYKYVNCHPDNPLFGKQTVVATGQLSNMRTGYPLMISEMTILTALRTAATSALATDLMSKQTATSLALIGTGAQSDFQSIALSLIRDIKIIYYYDVDVNAMERYNNNMQYLDVQLIPCNSVKEAVKFADIIVTCTACKKHVDVVMAKWIKKGVHINALGGDCKGKTELELEILSSSKVVVEFFEQSFKEGEIQRFNKDEANKIVHAELWELITNRKVVRTSNDDITVFDSVGFALEDFSVLNFIYKLAHKYNVGQDVSLIPQILDPKNLISTLYKNETIVY